MISAPTFLGKPGQRDGVTFEKEKLGLKFVSVARMRQLNSEQDDAAVRRGSEPAAPKPGALPVTRRWPHPSLPGGVPARVPAGPEELTLALVGA